jgi:hypothetical protein
MPGNAVGVVPRGMMTIFMPDPPVAPLTLEQAQRLCLGIIDWQIERLKRILKVSKAELDRRVEAAKRATPRADNPMAPGEGRRIARVNAKERRKAKRENERAIAFLLSRNALVEHGQHQAQEHHAGHDGQPTNGPAPKDYPLVPLTIAVGDLKKAYAAAQEENGIQQKSNLGFSACFAL